MRGGFVQCRAIKSYPWIRLRIVAVLTLLPILIAATLCAADESPPVLRTAAQVLALPADQARTRIPVVLRGVVTASEPDWAGRFFLQDESGGIFIHHVGRQPEVGDLVEVNGISSPGAFAPTVHVPGSTGTWKKIGTAPLPEARPVTIERLMAGVEDGRRVELTGIVRSAQLVPARKLAVEVSSGGYRVRVFPKLGPHVNPQSLVAARVRVRGTAATSFNAARRQLTAVNLYVPTADDFVVEEAGTASPFDQPLVALGDVARYRPGSSLGARVHVRGVVTFQRDGLDMFIQDSTGGLHVESTQVTPVPPGRTIEAVGFLEYVNYQPVLRDTIYRQMTTEVTPVAGAQVPFAELRDGLHGAEKVVLRGKLMQRSVRHVSREQVPYAGTLVSCTIQNSDLTFTARCETVQEASLLTAVALGSVVEVTGVAVPATGDDGKLRELDLLLANADDLKVIEAPSGMSSERLLIGLVAACVLLAGVAVWTVTVTKKNAMLRLLAAEREQARKELQQAHDTLEVRVQERTEQLQTETSVRKAAEVEFRAVLTERTRLARDLHDTLEQALTGIALQLDTAVKLFARQPEDARQRVELAREFLRQSQLELRRSIWDLRSRELEQFDLAEALVISSRQIAAGAGLRVDCVTAGTRRRLPETVEESLLRIAQEALTNVVKHAGATEAFVRLTFNADTVSLEVRDNGRGFNAEKMTARTGRQFGLLGMSERAKRLRGRLEVSGAADEGATVRVTVPITTAEQPAEISVI